MKLSDVKGERTLDVIADIIDPVANIAESDAVKALLKKEKLPKGEKRISAVLHRIRENVPALLRNHKRDIISILSTIAGQSYGEYAENMSIASLARDLNELISDEPFVELFMQAQTVEPSGSAQENTEAR